jgi:glycosyltransferase involved in cell wall biosynthesis
MDNKSCNTKVDYTVIIDITRLIWYMFKRKLPTGIDLVCLKYVKHYRLNAIAAFSCKGRYFVLNRKSSYELFEKILSWNKSAPKWQLFQIIILIILGIDRNPSINEMYILNIGHSDLGGFNKLLQKYELRLIFLLHDLFPLEFPEYYNGSNLPFRIKLNNAINYSSIIIVNSKDTELRLCQYAKANNMILPPTKVALLGTKKLTMKLSNQTALYYPERFLDQPYFIIVGTIEPRKNHLLLLNIWRRLVETKGDKAPNLIIIGQRGWKCKNIIDMLDDCTSIKNKIFETNNCRDADLYGYLSNATALLFPSFAEGYGLPLVEALQLGVPVIASDIEVFHEIAGDIPDYIDPLDAIKWMSTIMDYAKPNSLMRANQFQRMIGYKVPTWDEHFKIVDEIIQNTL